MMIDIDDRYGIDFEIAKLEVIKESLTPREIELVFVSDDEISEINSDFRGKNAPTDVLSFPLEDMPHSPLGTVVISIDTAKRVAEKLSHNTEDEVALLFIHGMLHLLGYDHECDEGQMREKESELIEKFGLPKSLIVRND